MDVIRPGLGRITIGFGIHRGWGIGFHSGGFKVFCGRSADFSEN
jgi:hypothetical protein